MGVIDTVTSWTLDRLFARQQRRSNPVYRVADRFRELLTAHGLALPQVLRFVPDEWQWSLEQLATDEDLLRALDRAKLAWFAAWLGVELDWLEGASDRIYHPFWFYKRLERLPAYLADRELLSQDLEIIAFSAAGGPLDRGRGGAQEVALVFSVPAAGAAAAVAAAPTDVVIRRYAIDGDGWTWCHPPCRRHLKTVARCAFLRHSINIPIVPVSARVVNELREGRRFPGPHVPSAIGGLDRLEDYALGADESAIAREPDEIEELVRGSGGQLEQLLPPDVT